MGPLVLIDMRSFGFLAGWTLSDLGSFSKVLDAGTSWEWQEGLTCTEDRGFDHAVAAERHGTDGWVEADRFHGVHRRACYAGQQQAGQPFARVCRNGFTCCR